MAEDTRGHFQCGGRVIVGVGPRGNNDCDL